MCLIIAGCSTTDASLSPASPSVSAATRSVVSSPAGGQAADTPTPSAAASAQTAGPQVGSVRLEKAALFGRDGSIYRAADIVQTPSGLIAVGTSYDVENMPVLGPVAQHGLIWHSADGRAWDEITPSGTFADATLARVYLDADGRLILIGAVTDASEASDFEHQVIWESADGRTWRSTALDGPTGDIELVAQGPRGYLAVVRHDTDAAQLWFSADGRTWSLSRSAVPGVTWSAGAGPEGFVVIGVGGHDAETRSTMILASSDGATWFEAPAPPTVDLVAPLGPDWIAVNRGPISDASTDTETPVWFSPNGLDWSERGAAPLGAATLSPSVRCQESLAGLSEAGGWLLSSTVLLGPCSEGRVVTYGAQRISADGAAWDVLPLPAAGASGRGSFVAKAIATGTGLVLVGQTGADAAIWRLE